MSPTVPDTLQIERVVCWGVLAPRSEVPTELDLIDDAEEVLTISRIHALEEVMGKIVVLGKDGQLYRALVGVYFEDYDDETLAELEDVPALEEEPEPLPDSAKGDEDWIPGFNAMQRGNP